MNEELLPCPRCSSRVSLRRPQWTYAHRTSKKRGVRCVIWTSECSHSDLFPVSNDPISDEAEIVAASARWNANVVTLFQELTKRWTAAQRALHARTLGIELPPE